MMLHSTLKIFLKMKSKRNNRMCMGNKIITHFKGCRLSKRRRFMKMEVKTKEI